MPNYRLSIGWAEANADPPVINAAPISNILKLFIIPPFCPDPEFNPIQVMNEINCCQLKHPSE